MQRGGGESPRGSRSLHPPPQQVHVGALPEFPRERQGDDRGDLRCACRLPYQSRRAQRGPTRGRAPRQAVKPPPPVDKDQAWARMERRSRCGSFDRWAQHHAPCPGCSGFACGECTVEGLWKEWNMNERSGSDQVADVEHVAARAAAAESILAFGDVPLARPVAPYGVGGVGAVRPLKEVAHGAPRSFARPAACRSADGHDVAVGRVSPSCVSGLWETFLRRGWRHSWLRARLVCFVQPRPTWLRWRLRPRLSPLIPQLFREAPATCVECVCVSASHARLVGACGCVSGREGPETNERKGILKEYENLT